MPNCTITCPRLTSSPSVQEGSKNVRVSQMLSTITTVRTFPENMLYLKNKRYHRFDKNNYLSIYSSNTCTITNPLDPPSHRNTCQEP